MTRALRMPTGAQMLAFLLHNTRRIHFIDEHEQSPYIYSARHALKYLLTAAKNLIFQELQKKFKGYSAVTWMSKMVFGGISVVL